MYGCLQQTGRQGLPHTQATASSRPARVRVVRARAAAQIEPKLEDIRGEAVRRGAMAGWLASGVAQIHAPE
jgi:hypothetical protein